MKYLVMFACACALTSAHAAEDGFVSIFNGRDLAGWEGDKVHYFAENGLLRCRQDGRTGGGNLWTEKDYQNFHLKFEFRLPPEANNGVSIRCPPGGHASQEGMEIQILDDTAPYYWEKLKLKPYQYHGSIYGVAAAKRKPGFTGPDAPAKSTYLKPVGEWNSQEIIADGYRIKVILNGTVIVDEDVSRFRGDGDTPDGESHAGLRNLHGRIGWCGHGYDVAWRNIRVKELPPSPVNLAGGRWGFDSPDGRAVWFGHGVEPNVGGWSLLCGGGSPIPADAVRNPDGTFSLTREFRYENHPDWYVKDTLTFRPTNGALCECSLSSVRGEGNKPKVFSGYARRIPELGLPPRLDVLEFGEPIDLLADGMDGWEKMEPHRRSFWTCRDGVLSNGCEKAADGKRIIGANIVTKRRDFKNFRLSYDVLTPKGGNSGVYLRGVYEIQTIDSQGMKPDCHNMGAVYGRITPSVSAEKWHGKWQRVEIILINRHATVTLNNRRIIDNKPILGCTGGALTSDEFVPGPIYIQGDHSSAAYRNMILEPVVGPWSKYSELH